MENETCFNTELKDLLKKYSKHMASGTTPETLADYLSMSLCTFNATMEAMKMPRRCALDELAEIAQKNNMGY